jgi:DNA repair protein SbcD/Mre11
MVIRFIHAADLHLDRPFYGMQYLPDNLFQRVSDSTFQALHQIGTYAIANHVDFVLIAGDLYDVANPSLRAERRFQQEVERLAMHDIPVYLIHGNHDPLDGGRMNEPHDNLVVFNDQVEVRRFEKEGKPTVNIYGFSYPTRHVRESMIDAYKKVEGADFHIGLLHGYLRGHGEHDAYAPFTIQELATKNFNYWALGHIHQRLHLHPDHPMFYSGTPQGLSAKETGDKGVNLVTLSPQGHDVTFLSTADILYETITLNLSEMTDLHQLIKEIDQLKKDWRGHKKGGFIRLVFEGQSPLHEQLLDPLVKKDLLQALQDGEEEEASFFWVTDYKCETVPSYPRDVWEGESHFLGDLIRQVNQTETIRPFVEELFTYSKGKRYLDPLEKEDEQQILKAAEQWLIRSLFEKSEGSKVE